MPLIGIDLDNTLIDYSGVFGPVGVALGLLPDEAAAMTKAEVRAYLRAQHDGEARWMRLQGQVYGRFLGRARAFPGVAAFLERLGALGAKFCVVSHKTRLGHFDLHRADLWQAARDWLAEQEFCNPESGMLSPDQVYFEETREGKLERIASLRCDAFIDDLPEVLLHERFPAATRRFWFAAGQEGETPPGLTCCRSWEAMAEAVESHLFKGRNQG